MRVLPTPPMPVSVTNRLLVRHSLTRASSSALPMKVDVSTGRAPWPRSPAGITNLVNLRPALNRVKRPGEACLTHLYGCRSERADLGSGQPGGSVAGG